MAMATLPPFARVLQARRTANERHYRARPIQEDPPESTETPRPSERYPSSDRRRVVESEITPRSSSHTEEINDLRARISNLESENTELVAENKRLLRVQTELETERQLAIDCRRMLDEATAQLRDEQLKSRTLQEQVQQLENLLDGRRQLTNVKEQMLQRIQSEYDQIMKDYTRILELNGVQTGQLRKARVDICELEAQVEEMKGCAGQRLAEPRLVRSAPAQEAYLNDFSPFDADEFAPALQMPDDNPDVEIEVPHSLAPRQNEIPTQAMVRSPLKRAALVDNIKFGDEPSAIIVDDVDSMPVDEMKDLFSVLRSQKEEVERRLNKAPEKGRLQAQVRREHEEQERELDTLTRRIAKIRFALRKLHAL
jgi:DNA repair exonuclease SbcCD ATPase subunit